MTDRAFRVLLVEDNPADALLAAELLKETGVPTSIITVTDGEAAISTLDTMLKSNADFPDLILLDLNLPKKNGHEVLRFIGRAHHANTFVAIYTGSSSPDDERNAKEHGADAYLVKPIGSKEMELTVGKFKEILTKRSKAP